MEGGYDENGSKRSQTRRLSRRYVFFKFPYYTKVNFYCIYRTITSTINDNEKSRQCPTQHLTSNLISDIVMTRGSPNLGTRTCRAARWPVWRSPSDWPSLFLILQPQLELHHEMSLFELSMLKLNVGYQTSLPTTMGTSGSLWITIWRSMMARKATAAKWFLPGSSAGI